MNPSELLPKLKPLLKPDTLLHLVRDSDENQGPIFVIDFDGSLAHCKYTTLQGPQKTPKVLEGWEDTSKWNVVYIIGHTTDDELKIMMEEEVKMLEHQRHPLMDALEAAQRRREGNVN